MNMSTSFHNVLKQFLKCFQFFIIAPQITTPQMRSAVGKTVGNSTCQAKSAGRILSRIGITKAAHAHAGGGRTSLISVPPFYMCRCVEVYIFYQFFCAYSVRIVLTDTR